MALYTPTYTFSNGTTADGGEVQTEVSALGSSVNSITNAQIANNAAIAISKTELDTYTPWTDWSPTPVATGAGSSYASAAASGQRSRFRYAILGKIGLLNCYERFTITGAVTGVIRLPLPTGFVLKNVSGNIADVSPIGEAVGRYFDGGVGAGARQGTLYVRHGDTNDGIGFTSLRLYRLGDGGPNPDWNINSGSEFSFTAAFELV